MLDTSRRTEINVAFGWCSYYLLSSSLADRRSQGYIYSVRYGAALT